MNPEGAAMQTMDEAKAHSRFVGGKHAPYTTTGLCEMRG